MSSNKTIKALREEREVLHAEVRRLQALAGEPPTIRQLARDARVKALNCPVLADNLSRLWMASIKPPSLQLLEAVDKVASRLPPMLLGYGSREEMEQAAGVDHRDSAILEAREQYREQLYAIGMDDEQQRAFWDRVDSGEAYMVAPLKRYDVAPFDPKDWPVVAPGQRLIVLRDAEPAPSEKWSLDGKNGSWDYDSLAELIRDNYGHTRDSAGPMGCDSDLVEGSTVYRAIECKDDPAGFLPGKDDVLEHMSERAYDSDAGEWADNYPEVDDAAKAELDKALEPLQAWARKHCQPDFFTVKNITPYTITEQDVNQ